MSWMGHVMAQPGALDECLDAIGQVRREAHAEGYAEGYAEGFDAGVLAGRRAAAAEQAKRAQVQRRDRVAELHAATLARTG